MDFQDPTILPELQFRQSETETADLFKCLEGGTAEARQDVFKGELAEFKESLPEQTFASLLSGDSDGQIEQVSTAKSCKRKRPRRRKYAVTSRRAGQGKADLQSRSRAVVKFEDEVAHAAGLHPFILSPEEEPILPEGADKAAYIEVRNVIIAMWRADVHHFLDLQSAGSSIQARHQDLVKVAWQFLMDRGYINFGVAGDVKQRSICSDPPQPRRTVVVIGAGLAGLSASRRLMAAGHNVLVLEAQPVPGGRVRTAELRDRTGATGAAATADLGGSIITGTDGNPLAVLAVQLGIPLISIADNSKTYHADGGEVDPMVDEKVTVHFDNLLEAASEEAARLGEGAAGADLGSVLYRLWAESPESVRNLPFAEQIFQWHCANLEFANASAIEGLSLAHWSQDDLYEFAGAHVLLKGGNMQLVAALSEEIPIMYNTPVAKVSYDKEGVVVEAGQTRFQADAAVVTVPLGVLKKGLLEFEPALPQRKIDAISRLGFGVLNKVVLLFPSVFWGTMDWFARLAADPSRRGLYYLFYSYAGVTGSAQLTALVAGKSALEMEDESDEQVVEAVMAILRGLFGGPDGTEVPRPVEAVVTRWGKDPYTFGSYSSMAVGSDPSDYEAMGESVGGRVFFAGEATIRQYPATMHGAFISGLRTAAELLSELKGSSCGEAHVSGGSKASATVLDPSDRLFQLFTSPDMDLGFGMSAIRPRGPPPRRLQIRPRLGRGSPCASSGRRMRRERRGAGEWVQPLLLTAHDGRV